MRRSWPTAALASCMAMMGCATLSHSSRVDIGPLQASLERELGVQLRRVPPPVGPPGIPGLRATFAGANDHERVTVLEFFQAKGIADALGSATSSDDTAVLRRANVAVLYIRTGGVDHHAVLERALDAAPLVTSQSRA